MDFSLTKIMKKMLTGCKCFIVYKIKSKETRLVNLFYYTMRTSLKNEKPYATLLAG